MMNSKGNNIWTATVYTMLSTDMNILPVVVFHSLLLFVFWVTSLSVISGKSEL